MTELWQCQKTFHKIDSTASCPMDAHESGSLEMII